jgi:protoporphyrinogen IX oxidase
MLILKAIHLIFMVTWFAGLFYLPRLFVYHADTADGPVHDRFVVMERRLFALMTIGGLMTLVFGTWLLGVMLAAGWSMPAWMHAKLALVALLVAYHAWCWVLLRRFATGRNRHTPRWFRWFNEAPSLALVAIILLAVLKPY